MTPNSSSGKRIIFLVLIGFVAVSLIAGLTTYDSTQSNNVTFAPLFQLLGKGPQSLSRAVSKVLPVDALDEGELGKALRSHYVHDENNNPQFQKNIVYLRELAQRLMTYKRKPFDYEIRLIDDPSPNAMAMPGGLILVTSGLLMTMKSESELMAVLGHELGHIELSHCFDAVKYELLSNKIAHSNLGVLVDMAHRLLVRHSFSKTQEAEADNYGFQMIVNSDYDPAAVGKSFKRLQEAQAVPSQKSISPLRDYFQSHPAIDQRAAKFNADARIWWANQISTKRYVGSQNLIEKVSLKSRDFGDAEWVEVYTGD